MKPENCIVLPLSQKHCLQPGPSIVEKRNFPWKYISRQLLFPTGLIEQKLTLSKHGPLGRVIRRFSKMDSMAADDRFSRCKTNRQSLITKVLFNQQPNKLRLHQAVHNLVLVMQFPWSDLVVRPICRYLSILDHWTSSLQASEGWCVSRAQLPFVDGMRTMNKNLPPIIDLELIIPNILWLAIWCNLLFVQYMGYNEVSSSTM